MHGSPRRYGTCFRRDLQQANGVEPQRAQLMFYAVYRFGPRWEDVFPLNHAGYNGPPEYEAKYGEKELEAAAEAVRRGDTKLSVLFGAGQTRLGRT